MSKIVQAINSMIANPSLITNVIKADDELFFLYKQKYKWSITRRDDGHHLWYYPDNLPLEDLAHIFSMGMDFKSIPMVHYHDGEIGTKEAKSSFAELYTTITEKAFGINEVLDDIISDGLI